VDRYAKAYPFGKIRGLKEVNNILSSLKQFSIDLDIIHDKSLSHLELSQYLIRHNTIRPHEGLNDQSPIDYLLKIARSLKSI